MGLYIWWLYGDYIGLYWDEKYWLVVQQPSWKMMEFVNGKDDIPYMKWKIIHLCLKPPTRISSHQQPGNTEKKAVLWCLLFISTYFYAWCICAILSTAGHTCPKTKYASMLFLLPGLIKNQGTSPSNCTVDA